MRRLSRWLTRAEWSPYAAGAGLGVIVTLSMGVFGHRLSGVGAYQHLSGFVGRVFSPASIYWTQITPTGLTWDVLVTIGGLVGAFAASVASRTFRVRAIPERLWSDVFGSSVARRWAIAFVGAMLTEIGGGIAGGCTASLAVSGGALFAPAAFVFMAAMFLGGIPTAMLVLRSRR